MVTHLSPTPTAADPQYGSIAESFVLQRQAVVPFVRDSIADAFDKQKKNAGSRGRKNNDKFNANDFVLLATANLPNHAVSNNASKLLPRYIGPFRIMRKVGAAAYTLELPPTLRLLPTFYVGRLKRYHAHSEDDSRATNRPRPLADASRDLLLIRSLCFFTR